MSLLLDLAEETSASDARAADRLDAEARELAALGQDAEEGPTRRVRGAARQATALALSRLPQAEASLVAVLEAFGTKHPAEAEIRLLEGVLKQAEAALRLVRLAQELWGVAVRRGFAGENTAELEAARKRLEQMAHRLRGDIRHRTHPWKPQDPERFAREMAQAKEGPFISAQEAIDRFRRPPAKDA